MVASCLYVPLWCLSVSVGFAGGEWVDVPHAVTVVDRVDVMSSFSQFLCVVLPFRFFGGMGLFEPALPTAQ